MECEILRSPLIGMGNTSTKISIPILEVLDTRYQLLFLKNRNFNSCDHVMLACDVSL